ncbi:BglG family transcription antiterminator [Bacillus canaveralius]|uniref:BglG family transcription antiterminator n=1 Tax=Bacillus canaveralius TaxID=1403243 RepID=UPI000F78E1DC|nr:BglG family transcription antiterminator [Bacillus canaveralius]RSK54625.1 transcription antiterminator [Bacillus canaveralius]
MELDDRSTKLLKEIILTSGTNIVDLKKKYNLTRRQVNYSLNKINEWLLDNELPIMENNRQAGLFIDSIVSSKLPEIIERSSAHKFVPSEKEREQMILLMLLSRQEELSLLHFSIALRVSRNTILQDLKGTGQILEVMKLKLHYSRRDGYFIDGKEFDKRKLIIELIRKLLRMANGEQWIMQILDMAEAEVQMIRSRLEDVENRLNVRFTDEKLTELPYILAVLVRRMRMQKKIKYYGIQYQDLSYTKEYQVVEELFCDIEEADEQERLFITLQLLSSNVSSTDVLDDENIPALIEITKSMLDIFEKLACVSFIEKDELVNRLYLHLRPAYYRMKYGLTVENPLEDLIIEEHKELHHLVKKSSQPLEKLLNQDVPTGECAYLTMLIGGWLRKQGEEISIRKKALVVCPNGISISKLLFETLREMFPEFIFLDHISVRDFQDYPLDYNIVFSTTFIRTDKKLFLVKPFISESDKQRLKLNVSQELYGFGSTNIDYDRLIQVIQRHATIKDKLSLKQALRDCLHNENIRLEPLKSVSYNPALSDLITTDNIIFKKSVCSWQEAVRMAAFPLLESNAIESCYVDTIIENFQEAEPYIVIAPRVAIPHARPEDGVNCLAMSLLILEEEVEFAEGLPVNLIIVIAAIDRKKHLKALMQLNDLVAEQENVRKIINSKDKKEIRNLIELYSGQNDSERGDVQPDGTHNTIIS